MKVPPAPQCGPVRVSGRWCTAGDSAAKSAEVVVCFTKGAQWCTLGRFREVFRIPEVSIAHVLMIEPRPTVAEVASEQSAVSARPAGGRVGWWYPQHLSFVTRDIVVFYRTMHGCGVSRWILNVFAPGGRATL